MKLIPAQYKHFILTKYRPNCRGNGFEALAKQYGVKGGAAAAAIKYWYDRWDGTPTSLERKPGAGRPPILSSKEIQQHITIYHSNQEEEPQVQTGTLQRYPSTPAKENWKEDVTPNSSTIWKGEWRHQLKKHHQADSART
jgi:hypothetical protein